MTATVVDTLVEDSEDICAIGRRSYSGHILDLLAFDKLLHPLNSILDFEQQFLQESRKEGLKGWADLPSRR